MVVYDILYMNAHINFNNKHNVHYMKYSRIKDINNNDNKNIRNNNIEPILISEFLFKFNSNKTNLQYVI